MAVGRQRRHGHRRLLEHARARCEEGEARRVRLVVRQPDVHLLRAVAREGKGACVCVGGWWVRREGGWCGGGMSTYREGAEAPDETEWRRVEPPDGTGRGEGGA